MSKKEKLLRITLETIMPGPVFDTLKFFGNKFSTIKSGNSLFELIVFVLAYYDVAAASYCLDHICHNLPIAAWLVWGLLISAFLKIVLMLLFDQEGIAK